MKGEHFGAGIQHRNNSIEVLKKTTSSLHFTEGKGALRQHQQKFRLKPRLPALGFQVLGECLWHQVLYHVFPWTLTCHHSSSLNPVTGQNYSSSPLKANPTSSPHMLIGVFSFWGGKQEGDRSEISFQCWDLLLSSSASAKPPSKPHTPRNRWHICFYFQGDLTNHFLRIQHPGLINTSWITAKVPTAVEKSCATPFPQVILLDSGVYPLPEFCPNPHDPCKAKASFQKASASWGLCLFDKADLPIVDFLMGNQTKD